VGVCEKSLRDWHHKLLQHVKACPDDATAQQMREEIKHLRKQLNLIGSCSALLFATFDDAAQMDFTTN